MMKKLHLLIITLVVLMAASYQLRAQTWNTIGTVGFSDGSADYQRIALIDDIPYVAYIDGSLSDKVTVMTYNGNSWQSVGPKGFTMDKASDLDFVTDNGKLYVAFGDYSADRKASVMTFDGESWVYLGPSGFTSSIAEGVSLCFDNGIPWIAFQDAARNSRVSVMKYEGGAWNLVGEAGFSTGYMTNVINLQVENGIPYVVYKDYDADYKTTVMKFVNGLWRVVGEEGFSGGKYDSYHGLALRNGIPYVAGWGETSKITVYRFDVNNWVTVGESDFSIEYANFIDIKFASNGNLYAFFKDTGVEKKAILKMFNGMNEEWIQVGEPVSIGEARFTSLALFEGPDGEVVPYVAYKDEYSFGSTTAKKFDLANDIKPLKNELLNVYPNPASDYLTIDFKGDFSKQNLVEIRSVLGQLIKTELISNSQLNTINISDLSSGIYIVRLTIGENSYNRKFTIL